MKAEHYFNELDRAIKHVSSKADLIIFEGKISKKSWDLLLEDVLTLQCFYTGYFGDACSIFKSFLENDKTVKKLTLKERKDLGSFFTPPYIADYIVKNVLDELIKKNKNDVDKICELKICDPALGGGIFIICAHNYLMRSLILIEQDRYTIEDLAKKSAKTLYGVDINPKAVEFSKMILNLNIAKWSIVEKLDEYVNSVENNLN